MATYEQLMEAQAAKATPVAEISRDLELVAEQVFAGDAKRKPRWEASLDEAESVFVRAYVPADGPLPESVTVDASDLRPIKPKQGVWLPEGGQFAGTEQREYDGEHGITVILNKPPAADIETVTVTFG
jgi:hypothetical protein